nr:hypothetical protein [Arabiibacter massiliensis]
MAELLTVVAILAILMGLTGIAVFNYVRDLTLTEYDNAAKSIYVAAQNGIADLQASGEWMEGKQTYTTAPAQKPTAPRTDDGRKTENDDDLYYYVSAQFAQQNGILPAGSIEAEVWGGDYIVEYRYDTATVYGVFYTEGGQTELNTFYEGGGNVRDRTTRRNHDPIVGYYGGAAAANLDSVALEAPVVSAGRSPKLGVTDPNLLSDKLKADKLVTLVTIEKALAEGEKPADSGQQIKLMLQRGTADSVVAHIVENGVVGPEVGFVELSGESGKKATYSIDLVQLKADKTAASYLSGIAVGDEYRVTARTTTSEKLCRPVYGYGDGIWPGASENVVFTSNIIADYETEADLYVYRDEVNRQGQGIVFTLENWYNNLTLANENLYYRIAADAHIVINGVKHNGQEVEPDSGAYAYPFDEKDNNIPHYVTFSIPSIAEVPDGTVMDINVNVYRENEHFDVPGKASKTLTIHVHVMNQRPFGYHVKDHGSYAEVVVTAGTAGTGKVTIAANAVDVVSDESSPLYDDRSNAGRRVVLDSIPAGGSASIKYFKTDTDITLDEGSFTVTGPGK